MTTNQTLTVIVTYTYRPTALSVDGRFTVQGQTARYPSVGASMGPRIQVQVQNAMMDASSSARKNKNNISIYISFTKTGSRPPTIVRGRANGAPVAPVPH
jgi:hypothetical protein